MTFLKKYLSFEKYMSFDSRARLIVAQGRPAAPRNNPRRRADHTTGMRQISGKPAKFAASNRKMCLRNLLFEDTTRNMLVSKVKVGPSQRNFKEGTMLEREGRGAGGVPRRDVARCL
jgi:hypothetical protein